jgi:hypothetical protein
MGVETISGIENLSAVHDSARKLYRNVAQEQDARQPEAREENPVKVSVQPNSSTMSKIGSLTDEKNLFAKSIRETDTTLGKFSDTLDKMKVQLTTIVKNWPPFSADSQERKKILMEYVSLRKEIERLTVPPPPKPVYENNTDLWEKLGYTDSAKLKSSIPEVSPTTTDSEVSKALSGVEKLQSVVADGRNELVRAVIG